ncbi:aldolase/citrate lyase family protein [Nocardioides sp. SYSU DS0651]|uniref:aldolase/citrate lyase family protein n=1 Tax=Nocardioides sp. SYSU DS0651 TaxID=3415955 RepID=UPI003F4BF961
MHLILITADPRRAAIAAQAGVDRVMVDLEMVGKHERQGHLDTVISGHTAADIGVVRAAAPQVALVVRTDPWPHAAAQVERALEAGADVLMLPMFTSADEVRSFVDLVDGRATTMLLLETPAALASVDDVLAVPGVDEIHVGLNDLHLALGHTFMFELVANGTVEKVSSAARRAGVRFGFGGVARLCGSSALPPQLILSEHVRLGSTQVILSRDFHAVFDDEDTERALAIEVARLRGAHEALALLEPEGLDDNAQALRAVVSRIVEERLSDAGMTPSQTSRGS